MESECSLPQSQVTVRDNTGKNWLVHGEETKCDITGDSQRRGCRFLGLILKELLVMEGFSQTQSSLARNNTQLNSCTR